MLAVALLGAMLALPPRSASAAEDDSPPSRPVVLESVGTSAQIELTWEASSDDVGVAGYLVHRDWQYLGWVPAGTTFTDGDVVGGTTYRYEIRAQDAAGNNSAPSTPELVTAGQSVDDDTPPTTPVGVVATATSQQAQVEWDAASDDVGVVGYLVHRNWQYRAWVPAGTDYVDTDVNPGERHRYEIRAQDAAGNNSTPSEPVYVTVGADDQVAPAPPTQLTATQSGTSIQLNWVASVDNEGTAGHLVHRDGDYVAWVPNGTSYVDDDVSPGQTYLYEVRGQDAAKNNSAPTQVSVQAGGAAGPIDLSLTSLAGGAIIESEVGLLVAGSVEVDSPRAIERLDVTLERLGVGQSWNGDSFVPGVAPFRLATGDDGEVGRTAYSVRVGTKDLEAGDYSVTVQATSTSGETVTVGPVEVTVQLTTLAIGGPESTILRPFDSVPLASDTDVVIRGYTRDPDGVSSVELTVTRGDQYFDGATWVGGPTTLTPTLTDPGASTTSWTLTIPGSTLSGGQLIEVVASATDSGGQVEQQHVITRPRNANQHTTRVALPMYDVARGATRLWALGDSITQMGGGFGIETPGYRYELEQMFQAADCNVDWVGSLDWNWNEDVSVQPDWTDRQHDGIASWSLYHTKNYVALSWQLVPSPTGNRPGRDLAAASGADIVLIHMGTNGSLDVTQDNVIPGLSADEAAQQKAIYNTRDMENLIIDIRAALGTDTKILMAQIINSHRPTSHPVPPLDTPRMINEHINQGYADIAAADPGIVLVDMATGYDPEWNLDGLHPGNNGALEMANRWRTALDDNTQLGACL